MPVGRRALGLTVVATALFGLARLLPGTIEHGAIDLLQLGAALSAMAVAWSRASRRGGRHCRLLVLLGAGSLAWALGQAYWTVSEIAWSRLTPAPSAADVGYLLAYPLLAAAMLVAPSSQIHGRSSLRRVLDWSVVATSSVFVTWALVVGPLFRAAGPSASSALTYPIADLLLITMAVVLLSRSRRLWQAPLSLLALGFAALAWADLGFAYLQASGSYVTGSFVDLGWIVGWLLIAQAAARVPAHDPDPSSHNRLEIPNRASLLVPALSMSAVGVVAVVLQFTDRPVTSDSVLWWSGVASYGLSVARSVTARVESTSLAAALSAKATESARLLDQNEMALTAAGMGSWDWDASTGRVSCSPVLEALHGMPPGEFRGSLVELLSWVHPDDKEALMEAVTLSLRDGRDLEAEYRTVQPDGEVSWVQLKGRARFDESNHLVGMIGVGLDVTTRRNVDQLLRTRAAEGEALAALGRRALASPRLADTLDDVLDTLTESLHVELAAVFQLEVGGRDLLLMAGRGWDDGLVGALRIEVGGSQAGYTLLRREPVVVDDLQRETRFRPADVLAEHGARSGMSAVVNTASGAWGVLGVHTTRRRVFSADDLNLVQAVANTIGAAVDRADAEERFRYRDLHDELTDLPNRALMRDRLETAVAAARRSERCAVALHIGLDRFTLINETFGHEVGDAVLVEVAHRLREVCGPADTVARFGGDEFVVAVVMDSPDDAPGLADRTLAALSRPMAAGDPSEDIFLSASLGVAVANGTGDAQSLVRDAVAAQARASARGGGRYEVRRQAAPEGRVSAANRARAEAGAGRGEHRGPLPAHSSHLGWGAGGRRGSGPVADTGWSACRGRVY